MFKVSNRNTRKRCEMSLKFTINTPEHLDGVLVSLSLTLTIFYTFFIVNFEHVIVSWMSCFYYSCKLWNDCYSNTRVEVLFKVRVSLVEFAFREVPGKRRTTLPKVNLTACVSLSFLKFLGHCCYTLLVNQKNRAVGSVQKPYLWAFKLLDTAWKTCKVRNRHQISLLILTKFKRMN